MSSSTPPANSAWPAGGCSTAVGTKCRCVHMGRAGAAITSKTADDPVNCKDSLFDSQNSFDCCPAVRCALLALSASRACAPPSHVLRDLGSQESGRVLPAAVCPSVSATHDVLMQLAPQPAGSPQPHTQYMGCCQSSAIAQRCVAACTGNPTGPPGKRAAMGLWRPHRQRCQLHSGMQHRLHRRANCPNGHLLQRHICGHRRVQAQR